MTFNPKLVAIFLAAKSSRITKSACNSVARGIVYDSPRPKLLCNQLNKEVKSLRNDVSKGKGMVQVLIFLGTMIAGVIGYFKWSG